MPETYTATVSIALDAPTTAVWDALTNPAKVKQYLFGTEMEADWKVGGKITYRGEWEGKSYEDHGTIVEIEPNKRLVSTYWSAAFGPDVPENYQTVTYSLEEKDGGTVLTLTQEGSRTEEARDHSQANWKMVLDGLKKVVEE